jgi:hypothetical protein
LILNTIIAIFGITGLYLGPMYLVMHFYIKAECWLGITALAGILLYFTWYSKLPMSTD